MSNDYFFEILHEQVSQSDQFEDQTHKRLAETLHQLISRTEQGVTIGLEGSWGSGKSTVINLLKEELKKDQKKTLFFAFDAWAHDGDPLRKIFLESLIASIDPDEQDSKLTNIRSEVSSRKKTVLVETKKSASKLGKMLSLSALPIPVGAALLTGVKYEHLTWSFPNSLSNIPWLLLSALFLSFLPLLVLMYWHYRGEKDDQGKIKWDVFESNAEESYTQDVTEDGERTSIEFEKYFNQIISYVFDTQSKYQYEQAIIVVDNLDRVDPEYAQNVWSTLQTFFQHRTSSLNNFHNIWANKLWFIIPFDKEGIKKIWQPQGANTTAPKDAVSVSDSFMEKCFQVQLEVPPPVMSAWIDYFKQCVNKSLTGWPKERKKEFIQSYIMCTGKLESSPSPRQMHAHINRAGALGLHWKQAMSAESICLYCLCRQSRTENELRTALLAQGIPNSLPTIKDTSSVKAELAGLLFGVNPDKGVQLLLVPEITSALSNGNSDKLKELEATHSEAFWLAFRASEDKWQLTETSSDEMRINTTIALATFAQSSQITRYVKRIEDHFLNTFYSWNLANFSYKKALLSCKEISLNADIFISKFNKEVKQRIRQAVNSVDENFPGHEIYHLAELEDFLTSSGNPLAQTYYNLDSKQWKIWLQHCQENDANFQSVLPAKDTFKYFNEGQIFYYSNIEPSDFDALVHTYLKYQNKDTWDQLPTRLIHWFNDSNRDYQSDQQYHLAIRLLASASEENIEALKNCVEAPSFWYRGKHSTIEQNPSLPFLVALTVEDFRANNHIPNFIKEYFDKSFDNDEIKLAYQYFEDADRLEDIWTLATNKQNIFARQILNTVPEDALFSLGALYVDDIPWEDEQELASAMEKLCKNRAFYQEKEEIIQNPNIQHKVISYMYMYGDQEAKDFVLELINQLKKEGWLKSLQENNELLSFIPDGSLSFSQAWVEYFQGIVSGEQEEPATDIFKAQFAFKEKVLDFNTTYKLKIAKSYFDSLSNDPLSDQGFEIIAPILSEHMKEIEPKNYEFRLSHWINNNQLERIKWFLNTEVTTTSKPSETIIASLTAKLKSTEDDSISLYKQLNQKLKLRIDIPAKMQKTEVETSEGDTF